MNNILVGGHYNTVRLLVQRNVVTSSKHSWANLEVNETLVECNLTNKFHKNPYDQRINTKQNFIIKNNTAEIF